MWQFARQQFSRLNTSFRRRSFEREMEQQIEQHIELLADRFMRQGMSAQEAPYAARR